MFAIYKKEIRKFFNTIEGYVIISAFFVISALLTWYIPSEYNILYNNQATLVPFFQVTPWILLFLIPAVTMKMISNETMEKTSIILLTKPIKKWEIIFSKFLASCTIGILSIIPTVIFVYSIYQLSEPKGNIDIGELIGSYIGLIMIIGCYSAIGIYGSSISKNTMISFIVTLIIILLLLFGVDLLGDLYNNSLLKYLSIISHYESISRGVLDSRDIAYFISLIIFFLSISTITIHKNR